MYERKRQKKAKNVQAKAFKESINERNEGRRGRFLLRHQYGGAGLAVFGQREAILAAIDFANRDSGAGIRVASNTKSSWDGSAVLALASRRTATASLDVKSGVNAFELISGTEDGAEFERSGAGVGVTAWEGFLHVSPLGRGGLLVMFDVGGRSSRRGVAWVFAALVIGVPPRVRGASASWGWGRSRRLGLGSAAALIIVPVPIARAAFAGRGVRDLRGSTVLKAALFRVIVEPVLGASLVALLAPWLNGTSGIRDDERGREEGGQAEEQGSGLHGKVEVQRVSGFKNE